MCFSSTFLFSAGSIQVDSAILLNSIVNLSDADVVTNFTNAMNASFNDDGMMGNMSIVPGSLVVSGKMKALLPVKKYVIANYESKLLLCT